MNKIFELEDNLAKIKENYGLKKSIFIANGKTEKKCKIKNAYLWKLQNFYQILKNKRFQ